MVKHEFPRNKVYTNYNAHKSIRCAGNLRPRTTIMTSDGMSRGWSVAIRWNSLSVNVCVPLSGYTLWSMSMGSWFYMHMHGRGCSL